MQNKIVLHEVCAKRSQNPELVTSLIRDANEMSALSPQLHQVAADALETVLKCCEQKHPRRDFIEVGSAVMVKVTAVLLATGMCVMQAQGKKEKPESSHKETR